jgi:hypothetical protein
MKSKEAAMIGVLEAEELEILRSQCKHYERQTQLLRQTLLDQYAMAAFNARMQKHHDWTLTDIAEQSWRDANALMKARNAKP